MTFNSIPPRATVGAPKISKLFTLKATCKIPFLHTYSLKCVFSLIILLFGIYLLFNIHIGLFNLMSLLQIWPWNWWFVNVAETACKETHTIYIQVSSCITLVVLNISLSYCKLKRQILVDRSQLHFIKSNVYLCVISF